MVRRGLTLLPHDIRLLARLSFAGGGLVMPGVVIHVRHSVGDETEHRGTWTFDAAGGGPTYATGGIPYTAARFGFQTLNTIRVDPVILIGGVAHLLYHDYGTSKVKVYTGAGVELANATNIAAVQIAWAAVGR